MQVRKECDSWGWRGLGTRLCYRVDLKLILSAMGRALKQGMTCSEFLPSGRRGQGGSSQHTCPHSGSRWIRKRCFLVLLLTLSPFAKHPWWRNSSHSCTSWSSVLSVAEVTWETPNQMVFFFFLTLIYLVCKLFILRQWFLGSNWAKGSVPTLRGNPLPLKGVSANSWELAPLGQALLLLPYSEVVQSSIDRKLGQRVLSRGTSLSYGNSCKRNLVAIMMVFISYSLLSYRLPGKPCHTFACRLNFSKSGP